MRIAGFARFFVSCPEWGLATAPVQRRAFNDVDWQGVIVEGLMERFDVRLMWYGDEGRLELFGILKSVQRQKGHQLAYGI